MLNKLLGIFNRKKTVHEAIHTLNKPSSEKDVVTNAAKYSRDDLKKLFHDDAWLENKMLNAWEYANGLTELETYPTDIIIPCSNVCNSNCIMCNIKRKEAVFVTGDYIEKKFAFLLPYVSQLGIVNFGEPLTNPNVKDIIKALDEYCDKRCNKYLTTNGIFLEEKFDSLKSLNNINVSLNAATEAMHEKIMKAGNKFEKVLAGIKKAVEYRRTTENSPRINITAVVSSVSLPEMPAFIDMGNELGVDSIKLRVLVPESNSVYSRSRTKIDDYSNLAPIKHPDFEKIKTEIISAMQKSKTDVACSDSSIDPSGLSVSEMFPFEEYKNRCFRPYTTACFFGDFGETVQSCSYMSDMPEGNDYPVYKENMDFMQIWNGEFYKKLRKSFIDNSSWKVCRECVTKV